jgi:hypothetical protein
VETTGLCTGQCEARTDLMPLLLDIDSENEPHLSQIKTVKGGQIFKN